LYKWIFSLLVTLFRWWLVAADWWTKRVIKAIRPHLIIRSRHRQKYEVDKVSDLIDRLRGFPAVKIDTIIYQDTKRVSSISRFSAVEVTRRISIPHFAKEVMMPSCIYWSLHLSFKIWSLHGDWMPLSFLDDQPCEYEVPFQHFGTASASIVTLLIADIQLKNLLMTGNPETKQYFRYYISLFT
jgi:hypothetical protein